MKCLRERNVFLSLRITYFGKKHRAHGKKATLNTPFMAEDRDSLSERKILFDARLTFEQYRRS